MDRLLSMVGLAVRAGKVRFGVYLTERAVAEGCAAAVVAAADLGRDNRKKIEHRCLEAGVPLVFWSNKTELGRAVGKDGAPVVCICDENLARAVVKLSKGKEGLPNEQ